VRLLRFPFALLLFIVNVGEWCENCGASMTGRIRSCRRCGHDIIKASVDSATDEAQS
jgi:hypothetical protein